MNSTRRHVLTTVGASLFAGCVGLNSGNDESGEQEVDLLLNWTASGLHIPYYTARERGYYEEEGISLANIKKGQGSDFSARQVGLGNEDLGITSSDQLLNINTRDLSPVCVAVIMQQSPVVLFSARDQFGSELTDPSQLAGMTIGSGPGMVRLMVETYLEHHGVLDSINYVDTGFDTVQQLLVGDIDVAGGVFGDVVDARHEGATIDALQVSDIIPSYGHVVAANESVIESNPSMLRSFLRATARGSAWAHNNPGDATDILVDAVPELEEARPNQRKKWNELATNYMISETVADKGWGWNSSEPWAKTYEILDAGGFLDGTVNPDSVWTNDLLEPEYEYIGEYSSKV